jgi:hypothetical protein
MSDQKVDLTCKHCGQAFAAFLSEMAEHNGKVTCPNCGKVNDDLKERLTRYRQIKISVVGRKSGNTISISVWFVLEDEKLYLLPLQGSDTQWYRNVLKSPSIRIDTRGVEAEFRTAPVTDPKAVASIVEKFREKYGAKDVKKLLFEIRCGGCG